MALPNKVENELINGIYAGSISVFELPKALYAYTVAKYDSAFFSGFGSFENATIEEFEKAVNFRQNIGRFSGAKTFQNVKDLTDYVFTEDGKKRPFADFKKEALRINKNYNLKWLKTEQDSVMLQSQNARQWLKFEAQADIFPTLEYLTVGDDRVRPSHKALNGLKLPVGHPMWNRIMPQNEWGCRCTVLQHESRTRTSNKEAKAKTRLLFDEFKKKPDFDFNPGKTDFIFNERGKGKHRYFKVPKEFSAEVKNNFGFPNVDEVTGKYI